MRYFVPRRMQRWALLLAVLLGFACLAAAQQPVGLGFTPFGSYRGGAIDQVNLSNGNLVIDFPLVSFPQRGGDLHLSFNLHYNGPTFTMRDVCPPIGSCKFYWQFQQGEFGVTVDNEEAMTPHGQAVEPSAGVEWIFWSASSADGANHILGQLASGQAGAGDYRSLDNSGVYMQAPTTSGRYDIIDRGGVHYPQYPGGLVSGDPLVLGRNGNAITAQAVNNGLTGYTDTMGRSIPIPPNVVNSTTLGDTTGCQGPLAVTETALWNVPGVSTVNNGVQQFKFCYATVNVVTDLPPEGSYTTYQASGPYTMLQSIVEYNGTNWATSPAWTFEYSGDGNGYNYGDLTEIILPTGGTITYTWVHHHFIQCSETASGSTPAMYTDQDSVATRTVDAGNGAAPATWTYQLSQDNLGGTVTDPAGNAAVYYFTALQTVGNCARDTYQTEADYYNGAATGTPLRKVLTTYTSEANPLENYDNIAAIDVEAVKRQTVLDNGKTGETDTSYGSTTFSFTDPDGSSGSSGLGQVASVSNYDYGASGPGPLLRTTTYTWESDVIPGYQDTNLLDLPEEVDVTGPAGNESRTQYQYDLSTVDGRSGLVSSGITTNLETPPGPRGNANIVQRWDSTSGTWLATDTSFFDTGLPNQVTDPAGNTTTYSYSTTDAGAYLTQTQYPDTSDPNLAHHVVAGAYDFNTGVLTSYTGQNGNTTNYTYDEFRRLLTANFPDGGETAFNYNDVVGSLWVERQQLKDAGSTLAQGTDAYADFDGLARTVSRATYDPDNGWDRVDTTYNGLGQVSFRSYPCAASTPIGSPVCTLGDTFAYDALGRQTKVTHSDGSVITTNYTGAATEVQDEGNQVDANGNVTQRVTRVLQHDALGRLVSVCEDDTGDPNNGKVANSTAGDCNTQISGFTQDIDLPTGFLTAYSYDALGNLTEVQQPGLDPRVFAYDSLSRLTSSDNPEANTDPATGNPAVTNYSYDTPGTYCASIGTPAYPGELVQKTDARGIATCYSYDQLHRLTLRRTSDDQAEVRRIALQYDELSAPGFNFGDGIGRLTAEWVGLAPEAQRNYQYDAMGRVTQTESCAPSNCGQPGFFVTAQYNLLGEVIQLTYPSGRIVQTQHNRAGRPTAVTGVPWGTQTNSVPYLGNTALPDATYTAAGQPNVFPLGNGLTDSFGYDQRWRLNHRETASASSTLLNLSLTDAPDSDVLNSVDLINAANDQNYGYDALNRLVSASSGAWGVGEVYDRYGNRWQQNPTGGAAFLSQLTFTSGDNRITTGVNAVYDASGDTVSDGVNTYCYDAQGQVLTVAPGVNGNCSSSSPLADYYYDAEGNRVEKQVNGASTDSVWWQGRLLAQRTGPLNNSTWHDFIYAGGRRIARATNQVNRLVVGGTDCSTCGWQASTYTFPSALIGYVIQSGDTLWLRQWQEAGTHGGVTLWFTDGTNSNWVTTDSSGQVLDDDQTDGEWLTRKVDLSQWAGKTVGGFSATQEGDTQTGAWQIQYEDIVLREANGTVVPIYTGQSSVSLNVWQYSSSSADSYSVTAAALPDASTGEDDSTVWYHTDQVGTTRLMTNTDGYPVWQGTFLPFGEELNPQAAVSSVKFTGKQWDAETGLDYFGARYYSGTGGASGNGASIGPDLGRFLTPDWSAQAEPVPYAKLDNPQSLNLYSYVLNNPVSLTDADGHFVGPGQGTDGTDVIYDWVRMETGRGPAPRLPVVTPGDLAFRVHDPCVCTDPKPPPKSWTPDDPLPSDPSGLGPDWVRDPTHRAPNDERFVNGKGDKLDWHKGIPGKTGEKGRDHWHWLPGGEQTRESKRHWRPGDNVRSVAAGTAIGAALGLTFQTIVDSAPVWWPVVLAF